MLVNRQGFVPVEKMTGHFQVSPQSDIARETDQDILPAARDIENLPALKRPGKPAGLKRVADYNGRRWRIVQMHPLYRLTDDCLAQSSYDGFYFGKFRHGISAVICCR
jgi:hypothetical protein